MAASETPERAIYTNADLVQVIKKYEELFRFFRWKLGKNFVNGTFGIDENDSLVDIKRWLVGDSNRMFWDYLCATHGTVQDEIRDGNLTWKFHIDNGVECTKLIFSSGKEVIFTRENLQKYPKWVIPLDRFFYILAKIGGVPGFTRINNELYFIEVKHFKSKEYNEWKQKIMKSTREEIINAFNITYID